MLEKRLMFWELKTDHVSKNKIVRLAGLSGAFHCINACKIVSDWIGLDCIVSDWIGLDWIGLASSMI
jgi:hypothetical protein